MDMLPINTSAPAQPASAPAPARAKAATATESSAAATATTQPLAVSEAQLHGAISAANEFIKPINSAVEFSLDKDSGATIVKVIDTATKEVIRQIPSEEMLTIAKALDKIQGLLIKQKA